MPSQAVAEILPEIIARYANGESLNTLAAEQGVNRTTIYRWMLSEVGDAHHDLITQCLVNRVAHADEALETAEDACNVTRTREIARFARMDLERRRPHLYGQKQEITVVSVDLTSALQAAQSRARPLDIVDAEYVRTQDESP